MKVMNLFPAPRVIGDQSDPRRRQCTCSGNVPYLVQYSNVSAITAQQPRKHVQYGFGEDFFVTPSLRKDGMNDSP